ncbi:HNH endonuclease signature motif containing protein [Georgenia subflava]|uniref:HNH endonuclease signature motif containing protein n=1 Tax=Georgenia subflava TaxID=1622177 RepID=UPI00186B18A3|nr:HNH endonuclease signature motif containing protein [Georgenia subflava]
MVWDHGERASVISGLDSLIQELTRYRGGVLLAHREDGRWGSARDRDFTDWRARTSGTGRGSAMGELMVAEGLEAMPEVAEAVDAGELTLEHAKALSRLRAGASQEVKAALENGAAGELIERAKAKDLTAPELAKAAKQVAATIDAQAAQDSFEATWRRRSLTTGKTAGGRSGQWVLDEISGRVVETALETIMGKPALDDERTRGERMADALVTMSSRVLTVGADLNGAQVRPHLALLVDQETWAAARRHLGEVEDTVAAAVEATHGTGAAFGLGPDGQPLRVADLEADRTAGPCGQTPAGAGADGATVPPTGGVAGRTTPGGAGGCEVTAFGRAAVPRLPDVAPAELEDGTLVPLGELQRIMCDCEMTRIVLDADSVPLDVGMTQRTYTKELRRAVTTRDRHCQWPGCTIKASWTEVHHVIWYSHNGPTSLENGMCACTYHHHVIHRDHIRVVPLADGFAFYRPDGTMVGTTHRRPRRPHRGSTHGQAPATDELTPPSTGEHEQLLRDWQQVAKSNGRHPPETPPPTQSDGTALPCADATPPPRSDGTAPPRSDGTAPPGSDGTAPPGSDGTAPPSSDRTALPSFDAAARPTPGAEPLVSSTCADELRPGRFTGEDNPPGGAPPPANRVAEPAAPSTHSLPATLWDDSLLEQPAEPPF